MNRFQLEGAASEGRSKSFHQYLTPCAVQQRFHPEACPALAGQPEGGKIRVNEDWAIKIAFDPWRAVIDPRNKRFRLVTGDKIGKHVPKARGRHAVAMRAYIGMHGG